MKNFYLLFVVFIYFASSFSQNNLAPCSKFNPSNAFENGLEYSIDSGLKVANDLIVVSGENFELRQITYNSFHDDLERIVAVNVAYYDDNGGLPGTLMGNELNVIPTSQSVYGTVTFAISRVVLDLTPFVFLGQLGVDSTYWVELVGTSTSGPLYWETTTATAQGNPSAQFEGGVYSIVDQNYDGVYEWFGECENILGVHGLLEGLISIYPNPVSDKLNISTQNGLEIIEVILYDVLGNKTRYLPGAKELDLETLSSGMYFLKIMTTDGNLTKRIIKK